MAGHLVAVALCRLQGKAKLGEEGSQDPGKQGLLLQRLGQQGLLLQGLGQQHHGRDQVQSHLFLDADVQVVVPGDQSTVPAGIEVGTGARLD